MVAPGSLFFPPGPFFGPWWPCRSAGLGVFPFSAVLWLPGPCSGGSWFRSGSCRAGSVFPLVFFGWVCLNWCDRSCPVGRGLWASGFAPLLTSGRPSGVPCWAVAPLLWAALCNFAPLSSSGLFGEPQVVLLEPGADRVAFFRNPASFCLAGDRTSFCLGPPVRLRGVALVAPAPWLASFCRWPVAAPPCLRFVPAWLCRPFRAVLFFRSDRASVERPVPCSASGVWFLLPLRLFGRFRLRLPWICASAPCFFGEAVLFVPTVFRFVPFFAFIGRLRPLLWRRWVHYRLWPLAWLIGPIFGFGCAVNLCSSFRGSFSGLQGGFRVNL